MFVGSIHRPEIAPGQAYERYILYIAPEFLQKASTAADAAKELNGSQLAGSVVTGSVYLLPNVLGQHTLAGSAVGHIGIGVRLGEF